MNSAISVRVEANVWVLLKRGSSVKFISTAVFWALVVT